MVRAVLAAAPANACAVNSAGWRPARVLLSRAVQSLHRSRVGWPGPGRGPPLRAPLDYIRALSVLLPPGEGPASDDLLSAMADAGERAALLWRHVVGLWQLTGEQWEKWVPRSCPGLGRVLPAVLGRCPSGEEAGRLVARMEDGDRQRLRTFALCLARAPPRALPAGVAWHLLAQFDADD